MRWIFQVLRRLDDGVEALLFDRVLPRHRGKVAALAALGLLCGGLWLAGLFPPAPAADVAAMGGMDWLKQRPWWDKYPNDRNATYHVYVFTNRGNGGVFLGAYVTLTAWRANYEFFVYKTVGSRLLYYFPENQTKGYTDVDIAESRNGRFDLKMTLKTDPKANNAETSYFSWKKVRDEVDRFLQDNVEKALDNLPAEFGR